MEDKSHVGLGTQGQPAVARERHRVGTAWKGEGQLGTDVKTYVLATASWQLSTITLTFRPLLHAALSPALDHGTTLMYAGPPLPLLGALPCPAKAPWQMSQG